MRIKVVIFDLDMWPWELNLIAERSLCGSRTQFNFRCVTVDVVCDAVICYLIFIIQRRIVIAERETGRMTGSSMARATVSQNVSACTELWRRQVFTIVLWHATGMSRDRAPALDSRTVSQTANSNPTTVCLVCGCARSVSRVHSLWARDIQLSVADWQYSYTVGEN